MSPIFLPSIAPFVIGVSGLRVGRAFADFRSVLDAPDWPMSLLRPESFVASGLLFIVVDFERLPRSLSVTELLFGVPVIGVLFLAWESPVLGALAIGVLVFGWTLPDGELAIGLSFRGWALPVFGVFVFGVSFRGFPARGWELPPPPFPPFDFPPSASVANVIDFDSAGPIRDPPESVRGVEFRKVIDCGEAFDLRETFG